MVSPSSHGNLLNWGTLISPEPATSRDNIGASNARPAVLQIVPRLDAGGAERSAIEIAAALAKAGFIPLVASEGGRLVPELEQAGGEWIPFPADAKAPHSVLRNAYRLRRIVSSCNVKLLHARSRAPAWSGLLAARSTKIPFVTTHHGSYSARSAIKRWYNSIMVRGDAVIANSQWTAAHIRAQYQPSPKELVVIPRGVDLSRFDPAQIPPARIESLRRQWRINAGDFAVLLPGRLTRWKGQHILIDAVAHLMAVDPSRKLHAVLAGDAQGRVAYEVDLHRAISANRLESQVTITGHVSDMPAAYLAADVVISASTQEEAFGRVAAEASAMARPVIATDHGGARETVIAEETGLLVPPGDALALADALERIMKTGDDRRIAMGTKGRAHIAENFTVERMCADTLALYRKLIGDTAERQSPSGQA